jgi:hypothetical protein
MTYRGKVKEGVVVLEGGVKLAEGTEVEVEPVAVRQQLDKPVGESQPTIWQKLAELSGSVKGLPSDAARNLDHYLYGHPKSEE